MQVPRRSRGVLLHHPRPHHVAVWDCHCVHRRMDGGASGTVRRHRCRTLARRVHAVLDGARKRPTNELGRQNSASCCARDHLRQVSVPVCRKSVVAPVQFDAHWMRSTFDLAEGRYTEHDFEQVSRRPVNSFICCSRHATSASSACTPVITPFSFLALVLTFGACVASSSTDTSAASSPVRRRASSCFAPTTAQTFSLSAATPSHS